jgi:4-carboxymuconolactone decarboxylase
VILNNPGVAYHVSRLGGFLRFETDLPRDVFETAAMVAAREADCVHVWSAHAGQAKRQGVRDEVIDAVAYRKSIDDLTADEQWLLNFCYTIVRKHHVDDATFAEAQAKYGNSGLLELVATLGYYSMHSWLNNLLQIPGTPNGPVLPQL